MKHKPSGQSVLPSIVNGKRVSFYSMSEIERIIPAEQRLPAQRPGSQGGYFTMTQTNKTRAQD